MEMKQRLHCGNYIVLSGGTYNYFLRVGASVELMSVHINFVNKIITCLYKPGDVYVLYHEVV